MCNLNPAICSGVCRKPRRECNTTFNAPVVVPRGVTASDRAIARLWEAIHNGTYDPYTGMEVQRG
jgi:hypothetical protein